MNQNVESSAELQQAHHHHHAGRLDAAAEIYARLCDLDQQNADALYGLGVVRLQQGAIAEASGFLDRAAQLEPGTAEFVANAASAREQLGQSAQAIEGYLQAANAAADDPEFLVRICYKLIALGRADAALSALSATPRNTPVAMCLAHAQSTLQDHGGAIQTLQKAASADPQNHQVWRALSTACAYRRNYLGAIEAFEVFLRLRQDHNPADYLAFADLLLMARQPAAAREALAQVGDAGMEHVEFFLLAAKCERLQGDLDSARSHLLRARELQPANGEVRQLLLETEPEETLPAFAADCVALTSEPELPMRDRTLLHLAAGRAFEKVGQYTEAFQQFDAGNEVQLTSARAAAQGYDPAQSESYAAQIEQAFAEATAQASETAEDCQPVFIVGMPRSGTTLLERMLTGLEDTSAGGENETLEFFSSQYFWDLQRKRARPLRDMDSDAWNQLAQSYWQRSGIEPTRVTDKMPNNFWHIGFIAAMFPASPLIHLRRDPRDVCLSIYSRMFPDGHRYATDLRSIAHYYSLSERIMRFWRQRFPERILTLQYEELVTNPDVETRRIAEFCGLRWDASCLEFHQRTDASFTFSELQVREPLNARGIGAWRRYADQLQPMIDSLTEFGVLGSDA